MWPAVFQIKRLPQARNRTAQRLRPTVERAVHQQIAVMAAAAVVVVLPKLEQ
jgi:K+-transporting ATPase c subunit